MIVTGWLTVVLIGTWPKLMLGGLAAAVLTPVPVHGERDGDALAARDRALEHVRRAARRTGSAVGVNDLGDGARAGPGEAAAPQVPKSNANGGLRPDPDAISVR